MSYTLRQVQPLLTKPELELFQASRAGPIKEFTVKRLSSKVTRSRALRDKYRDMYKRQTVKTQRSPAPTRKALGGENTRTQTKSEIFDEVLQRFEAQHAKLLAKEAKAQAAVEKRKPAQRTATAKPAAKKRAPRRPAIPSVQSLVKAVRKAVERKAAAHDEQAHNPQAHHGEPDGSPEPNTKFAAAPTDITPITNRLNPLKAQAANRSMHAAARSQTRSAQAKRDAR